MTALLRVEGLALCLAAIAGYAHLDGAWWLFFVLLLVPDLSMVGYLAGPAIGAAAYNAAHTTILPLCLAVLGIWGGSEIAAQIGAIWLVHIGIDRALGYGLKFRTGFTDTHLGRIGPAKAS